MEQKLFDIDNVAEKVTLVNKGLLAPYVSTTYSTFGGLSNVSLTIKISLDEKESWLGSMFNNSRYAIFHLSNNGFLEMFSGNLPKNIRRTKVESVEEAISKINKYLISPAKYSDGGNIEGSKQMKYPAASQSGFSLDTLVPANMYNELKMFNEYIRTYIAEKYNMTIVQYVAFKLHYESVDDLFYSDEVDEAGKRKGRFSIEQIDAIATAIFNHEENNVSIIIADQTGVGKGRTAAGLIRYAFLELKTLPIFVTEKKHLLVDIYRDLIDIGFEANVPVVKIEKEIIKKDEYSKDEIVRMIIKDYSETDDLAVDYELPETETADGKKNPETLWFTKDKFKSFPSRKKIKDDDEYLKYEEMYEEIIALYEQKLIEEGYEKRKETKISQDEIDRLTEEAAKKGRYRLMPFAPSKIDIVNANGDILYPKMKDDEIKKIYGYEEDEKGKLKYDFASPPIDRIELPSKYSLIAAPYSMLREETTEDDAGNEVVSPKFRFYEKVVSVGRNNVKAVLILDEAHTASGGSSTFRVLSKLIDSCKMTTYLSATYAKRPDNMPLYAKGTSLKESGLSDNEMVDVFKEGGTALQEAVSAELTKNGQILRREKLIQGKTDYFYVYDDDTTYGGKTIGRQQRFRLDRVSEFYLKIIEFQGKVSDYIRAYRSELPTRADNNDNLAGSKDEVHAARTVRALTFQLFNFFIVGIKLDQLEYEMINKMENGRKLVMTIANTMESALKNMPKEFISNKPEYKYKIGDPIENDFKLYLAYMLFYTMRFKLTVEKVDNLTQLVSTEDEDVCVFDSSHDLAIDMVANFKNEYFSLLNEILATKTNIPIAPIDVIKHKINGYVDSDGYTHKIEEITGRSLILTFPNKEDTSIGIIEKRKVKPTVDVVKDFNSNVIDHLIINKSGAAGISMHARPVGQANIVYETNIVEQIKENGEKEEIEVGFPLKLANKKEVKKRAMIVLQMELDINSEVQKLGRISRTGMVYRPEYTYVVSCVPSEARLTAMMERKLRSLSANVSSNQEQSSDTFSSDDFFSDVAIEPFRGAMDSINERLPQGTNLTKEYIKEFTKQLYFSTFDRQRDFYNAFARLFKAHIEYLEKLGEYTGKMALRDYRAEEIDKNPFYIGSELSQTTFGRHAVISKVMADVPILKNNEKDITSSLDAWIKAERYYGGEFLKFENIEEYKTKVPEKIRGFAKDKIQVELDYIAKKQGEIEFDEISMSQWQKKLDLLTKDGAELLNLISQFNIVEKEFEDLDWAAKFEDLDAQFKKAKDDDDFDKAKEIKGDRDKAFAKFQEVSTRFKQSKIDISKLIEEKDKLTSKLDDLKKKLEKFEEITNGKLDITEEYIESQKAIALQRIETRKRYIQQHNESIRATNLTIDYYKKLEEKLIYFAENLGGVFVHNSYSVDENIDENNELTYKYSLIESSPCVIIGIDISSSNFVSSNFSLKFINLAKNESLVFSKIFSDFSEDDLRRGIKNENDFTLIANSYDKYWDKEILMKTPATKRDVRWIISGNVLRGFKGCVDIKYLPNIIKYSTLERVQRVGIEINNTIDEIDKSKSTYNDLQEIYSKDFPILFDCNSLNFARFIQGFLYDNYIGKIYDAHRTGQVSNIPYAESRYMFQFANKSGLAFLVVEADSELRDYSNALRAAALNNRMEDVSEMSEEEFISHLSVQIVSEETKFTDVFAFCLNQISIDYNYAVRTRSRNFPSAPVVQYENFTQRSILAHLYKFIIPVNVSQIREYAINNKSSFNGPVSRVSDISFEGFSRCVEYMEQINAKATLGVMNSFYNKYSTMFTLEDVLEQKTRTIDNIPEQQDDEISKMIEELIKTLEK